MSCHQLLFLTHLLTHPKFLPTYLVPRKFTYVIFSSFLLPGGSGNLKVKYFNVNAMCKIISQNINQKTFFFKALGPVLLIFFPANFGGIYLVKLWPPFLIRFFAQELFAWFTRQISFLQNDCKSEGKTKSW